MLRLPARRALRNIAAIAATATADDACATNTANLAFSPRGSWTVDLNFTLSHWSRAMWWSQRNLCLE